MPLYSSDTAEEEDDDNEDDSDQEQLTGPVASDLVDGDHFAETSADLTKPLVDNDEEEDSIEEDNDDNGWKLFCIRELKVFFAEADAESSIGSASDLQQSDDESNDEDSDSSAKMDDDNSTDQDNSGISDSFELVNFDDSVMNTRFKYGLVKNHSSVSNGPNVAPIGPTCGNSSGTAKQLSISRVEIKSVSSGGTDQPGGVTIDDETSVSNSSVSSKNIDSIDHLIGHVEGHRPLLEEDEEEETVKPFIEIDQEVDYVPPFTNSAVKPEMDVFSIDPPPPLMQKTINDTQPNSNYSSYGANSCSFVLNKDYVNLSCHNTQDGPNRNSSNTLHSDFETLSLQQISDESDENRRLDEEVELSLNMQVMYDQLTNKDLFGSIPFTDKDLIVSLHFSTLFLNFIFI